MSWIVYALSLSAYYAWHSIMASEFMKSIFRNRLGIENQTYRLVFNIVALATTVIIIRLYGETESIWEMGGHPAGYLFIVIGFSIVSLSVLRYGMLAFAGIKKETLNDKLITDGLNRFVRHPLYVGVLIALSGWLIVRPTIASVVTLVVTWIYVQIGIYLEEKKLVDQYGKVYKNYQKAVPKLWPLRL